MLLIHTHTYILVFLHIVFFLLSASSFQSVSSSSSSCNRRMFQETNFANTRSMFNPMKGSSHASIRRALIVIALALPLGSFDVSHTNFMETCWPTMIMSSTTSIELLKCVLLFEYYIVSSMINSSKSSQIRSLPFFHAAIDNVSYSSIAYRLFMWDSVLLYDSVINTAITTTTATTTTTTTAGMTIS